MSDLRQHIPLYTPTFFLGFAYHFLISLHFTNNAIYPLYVTHEGGGIAMVGIFMGIYSVSAVAGRPLVGYLIDRYGVRSILILGSLALSLPAFGYLFLLDQGLLPFVWILRAVQGFGYGAHFTATFTLAAQIAPPVRQNESIAMFGVSGLIGTAIGPYVGEYLVRTYGLNLFFIAMAFIGISAALTISMIRVKKILPPPLPIIHSFLNLFRSANLTFVFVLAFLFAMSSNAATTFLATVAKARSISQFSLYFTAWGISGVSIRFIGGRWGDRIGPERVLIPGLFLYASGMLTIHFSTSLIGFIIAGILVGTAHGVSFPAITSFGYSRAPDRFKGSAMALITGMMDAGGAVMALVVGPLAEAFGLGIVFPIAASASLIGCTLVVMNLHRHDKV